MSIPYGYWILPPPPFVENGPSSRYRREPDDDSQTLILKAITPQHAKTDNKVDNAALFPVSTAVTTDGESYTDNFQQFAKFPPEIQKTVWELSCYIPRTVPIWIADKDTLSHAIIGGYKDCQVYRFATDSPAPAIMQVCQESRYIAMKVYKRLFQVKHDYLLATIYSPGRIWVNPETDLICPTRKGPQMLSRFSYQQFQDFCAVLKHYKIANVGIDDQSSFHYGGPGHDEWHYTDTVPLWLGPHIKNIVQYTTRNDKIVDMTNPLTLVNYTRDTHQASSPHQIFERDFFTYNLRWVLNCLDEYKELQKWLIVLLRWRRGYLLDRIL